MNITDHYGVNVKIPKSFSQRKYDQGFQDGAHYAIGEILEDLFVMDIDQLNYKWRVRYDLRRETLEDT